MNDPIRRRRALTNVGGDIDTAGDPAAARRLALALKVPPSEDADDDPARSHVHGFHTYPARMHPDTAARLVAAFVPPDGRVLDPFCGSGTVLAEALIAGRRAAGTDLNPLAVRLAQCKTWPRTPTDLPRLIELARECTAHADDRRKRKAGATRQFPHEDVALFEPHVLLELDSLRDRIEAFPDGPARSDLGLILSALLVKLSRKKGDTSADARPRRSAPGFASKLFVQKAEDLARRLGEFARMLPTPRPPAPIVDVDDATVLESVPAGRVDAVVTSPPYAATYDYLAHHALRLRWLGLDGSWLAQRELGSRSVYQNLRPGEVESHWAGELAAFFRSVARVLPVGGPLVLVMADSALHGVALRADDIVAGVARACGYLPVARASQPRPHFHGPTAVVFAQHPRREHAILLRKR